MADRDSTPSSFDDCYELPAELREAEICRPQCLVDDAETIPAPLAAQWLRDRLGVTPGEILLWVRHGRLTAFDAAWLRDGLRRRVEFDEHLDDQRARTESEMLVEYRFLRAEVEQFEPGDRFISLLTAIERLCECGVDYDMARATIEREYHQGVLRGFTAQWGWRNPPGTRSTKILELEDDFLFQESQIKSLAVDQFGIDADCWDDASGITRSHQPSQNTPEYTTTLLRIQREAITRFFSPRRAIDPKQEEVTEWILERMEAADLSPSKHIASAIFTIIKPADHDPKKRRG